MCSRQTQTVHTPGREEGAGSLGQGQELPGIWGKLQGTGLLVVRPAPSDERPDPEAKFCPRLALCVCGHPHMPGSELSQAWQSLGCGPRGTMQRARLGTPQTPVCSPWATCRADLQAAGWPVPTGLHPWAAGDRGEAGDQSQRPRDCSPSRAPGSSCASSNWLPEEVKSASHGPSSNRHPAGILP